MRIQKVYDTEFGAEPLRDLKRRDVLGSSNLVHYVSLTYKILAEAEGMENRFQKARRENPLLETTAPEVWIAAEYIPLIREIRSNVEIDDLLLSQALQRYLNRKAKGNLTARLEGDEQPLTRTIEPYINALKDLLLDVCDRRKSLRGILRLPAKAYTGREVQARQKPRTLLQLIVLQGIQEGWPNHKIAKELDDKGVRPRNGDYAKHTEMLRNNPQSFYSMKSRIKNQFA